MIADLQFIMALVADLNGWVCRQGKPGSGNREPGRVRDLADEGLSFWQYAPACGDQFPHHHGKRKRSPASLLGTMCGAIQTGALFASRFEEEPTTIDSLLCCVIRSCSFE